MICLMGLVQSATDLNTAQLNQDFLKSIPADSSEICGAVFNEVVDRTQKAIDYQRSQFEIDAITQFFFKDVSSSLSAAAKGDFRLGLGLSPNLISELHPILCLQNTVVAPAETGANLKRMSTLRKRPEVSSETFQKQWFELHAILAKRLKGLAGYRQNLVIDGTRDEYGHLLVDGMVELWFPSTEAIHDAFQSDIGNTLMMHAREFISEISTFIVNPVKLSGIQ